MAVNNLAEAITEDIATEGLAELVSPGTLRSTDGDTVLELVQEDETVIAYENGDYIAEFPTSSESFSTDVMATIATSLNF